MKPIIASLLLCLLCTFSCKKNDPVPPVDPPILNPNSEIARTWAATTLFTVRYSFFNTPTYTSRSLGYMGLAMYESIINGDSSYASMSSQLNELGFMSYVGQRLASGMDGWSWLAAGFALVMAYVLLHVLFVSQTAPPPALFGVFLGFSVQAGVTCQASAALGEA